MNELPPRHRQLIATLQAALDEAASPQTKAWWEGYLKHVIPFRGVGIPAIRDLHGC